MAKGSIRLGAGHYLKVIKSLLVSFVLLWSLAEKIWAVDDIRISYSAVNARAALVWIAEQRGLYRKYGLASQLVYIPGGSTVVQALVSGDIDLAQMSAPPGFMANLRGADIVYMATSHDRMGYQLVTRPQIKEPSDLKGAKLGISRFGSSSEFATRLLLGKINVNSKDITILQIGNEAERLIALKSERIDGSVFNAPFGREARRFSFNILADAGALGITYFDMGISGSRKLLEREERKVLNFLRAYLEAIKVFKNEPEYTLGALARFTKVTDMDVVKESYEYNRDWIPDIPYPSLAALQATVALIAEREPKAAGVDYKKYVVDRFLRRLDEEGFIKRLYRPR